MNRTNQRCVEAEGSSDVRGSASPWRYRLRTWRNMSASSSYTSVGAVQHRPVAGATETGRMEVGDKERRARPGCFILDGGRHGPLGFRARWLDWRRRKAGSERETYRERRRCWGRPAAGKGDVRETCRIWGSRRWL
jgi:hypothetical protein